MSTGIGVLVGAGLRGRRRAGLIATFAVLVLAAVAIAAGLVVSGQGAPLLDAAADDADVAHLVLYGDRDAVAAAAGDPEVVASSGPFDAVSGVELRLSGETVPIQTTALDSPDIAVNRSPMQSGRWAAASDEIVLDYSASVDLAIDVGDAVTLRRGGRDLTFSVVGTAVNFTDCFYPQCDPARTWVTQAGLERFAAGDDTYAVGYLRFDDPTSADPFVERQATAGVEGINGTDSWLDTRGDFLTLDQVFGSFVAAFGVFVLVVAAVIIAGSTAMRIVTQRRDIALMGAIGSTPRQIMAALLVENVVVGLAAGALGWFLAGFLAPSLQLGIGRTLGPQDPSWSVFGLVVCLAVIVGLLAAVLNDQPAVVADVVRTKHRVNVRRRCHLDRRRRIRHGRHLPGREVGEECGVGVVGEVRSSLSAAATRSKSGRIDRRGYEFAFIRPGPDHVLRVCDSGAVLVQFVRHEVSARELETLERWSSTPSRRRPTGDTRVSSVLVRLLLESYAARTLKSNPALDRDRSSND